MSSKKKSSSVAKLSEPLQEASKILKFLQNRQEAEPFLEPVEWEFFGLSDYPEIIKNPMDLGTIQKKIGGRKVPHSRKIC